MKSPLALHIPTEEESKGYCGIQMWDAGHDATVCKDKGSGQSRNEIRRLLSDLSWKCRFFRCRPQLVLTTWCRVFLTRRPDTADVSATSCDVGFFISVSYVVSLPNCRHVVVGTTTTYPFLSCSGWRHLSRSCFCHLLVGAKSIITRAGTVVSSFSLFSLKRWFETTATNPKQPIF